MSHLAATVLKAARTCKARGTKAWLDDVHEAYCRTEGSRIALDVFKATIVQDVDCRMMLSRCDLVQAYPASKVEASNAHHLNSTFNFVKV